MQTGVFHRGGGAGFKVVEGLPMQRNTLAVSLPIIAYNLKSYFRLMNNIKQIRTDPSDLNL